MWAWLACDARMWARPGVRREEVGAAGERRRPFRGQAEPHGGRREAAHRLVDGARGARTQAAWGDPHNDRLQGEVGGPGELLGEGGDRVGGERRVGRVGVDPGGHAAHDLL